MNLEDVMLNELSQHKSVIPLHKVSRIVKHVQIQSIMVGTSCGGNRSRYLMDTKFEFGKMEKR